MMRLTRILRKAWLDMIPCHMLVKRAGGFKFAHLLLLVELDRQQAGLLLESFST